MANVQHDPSNSWHLQKQVPVALILATFVNFSAIVWQAATLTAQVETLRIKVEKMDDLSTRLVKVETKLDMAISMLDNRLPPK